jgi:hypothetical protein
VRVGGIIIDQRTERASTLKTVCECYVVKHVPFFCPHHDGMQHCGYGPIEKTIQKGERLANNI